MSVSFFIIMFNLLIKQISERDGVNEQLKADKQMEWITLMQKYCQRAIKIVNTKSSTRNVNGGRRKLCRYISPKHIDKYLCIEYNVNIDRYLCEVILCVKLT